MLLPAQWAHQRARTAYSEGERLARELLAEFGKTPERLRDLSVSMEKLGDVARALGRPKDAQAAYAEGERLARELLAEFGKTPERLRDLSVSMGNLGDVARSLGHLDEALAAYTEQVGLARELVAVYGETVPALVVLATGEQGAGDVLDQQGEHRSAQVHHARARDLFARLAPVMPHERRYADAMAAADQASNLLPTPAAQN